MSTLKNDLDEVNVLLKQTKEKVGHTITAMGLLNNSKKDFIESLKNLGVPSNKGFKEFNEILDAHMDELQKITDEMNRLHELQDKLHRAYQAQKKRT